jgi:hypothetical protein
MRTIERTCDIHTPASAVWAVLTATDQYQEWNPCITQLAGPLRTGSRLVVSIRTRKRTMTFRPNVVAFQEGTVIGWRGRLGVPGLFDGEHELRVEPTAPGERRFTQRASFRGILVPLLRRVIDDTDTGFAAMNAALTTRTVTHVGRRV